MRLGRFLTASATVPCFTPHDMMRARCPCSWVRFVAKRWAAWLLRITWLCSGRCWFVIVSWCGCRIIIFVGPKVHQPCDAVHLLVWAWITEVTKASKYKDFFRFFWVSAFFADVLVFSSGRFSLEMSKGFGSNPSGDSPLGRRCSWVLKTKNPPTLFAKKIR